MSEKIEEKIEEASIVETVEFFVNLDETTVLIDWKKLTQKGDDISFLIEEIRLSRDGKYTIISVKNVEEGDTILLPNWDDEKVAEGLRFWKSFGRFIGLKGEKSISKLLGQFPENQTFSIEHLERGRVFNFY